MPKDTQLSRSNGSGSDISNSSINGESKLISLPTIVVRVSFAVSSWDSCAILDTTVKSNAAWVSCTSVIAARPTSNLFLAKSLCLPIAFSSALAAFRLSIELRTLK